MTNEQNRKGLRLSDEEIALFTAAMKRDGMTAFTSWMKSVCSRYARGELVPRTDENTANRMQLEALVELRSSVERLKSLIYEKDPG